MAILVFLFEGEKTAEYKLENLATWRESGLVEIEDAVVASRAAGTAKVKLTQTKSVAGKYSLGGAGLGAVAGMLLGGPIGGAAVGAAVGAITGKMKDIGLDDDFIKQTSAGLGPDTSALFIMGTALDRERLIEELKELEGVLVMTNLPEETEKELRRSLGQ